MPSWEILNQQESVSAPCFPISESPSEEDINRLLYGGILKKIITREDPLDFASIELGEESVVELSCAHAIMKTVHVA